MLLTTAPIFFPDLNNKFFIFANSNSAPMSWREQIGLDEGSGAVTWLRLSEATALIDHDVQKARERLERAISKAGRVRPGGLPQPMLDPNVPLRIQVTLSPGLRIEGRAWLDNPVLHW